jgi:hypothetical protein
VYGRIVRSLSLAFAAAGLLACDSTSAPVPVYEHHVTAEMVTGAALAALRADGRFNVQVPATDAGELSQQEATAQTLQFARFVTNNVNLRTVVEGGRGGYWTDPHLLTICADPAHYVHSQLGVIPTDSIPVEARDSFLQRLGPQWLIALCGPSNEPQMVVQAAIDGNSIRFVNGEPADEYPGVTSAWFPRGVPLNWPDVLPISRERAVRFAFETFGVRVSEVPQLLFRGNVLTDGHYDWFQIGSARHCNRWRVVLESDVALRGQTTFTMVTSDTVYIGSGTCNSLDVTPYIHLPLADQPATVRLDYFPWSVQAPVVSPIRFEIGSRAP